MSVADFAKADRYDRLTYWSWQSRGLSAFAKQYYAVTGNPLDKLPAVSRDNTAQEIDTISTYNILYILTIEDNDEREKALLTVLTFQYNSDVYQKWESLLKNIPSEALSIPLFAKNVATKKVVAFDGPPREVERVVVQDIVSVDGTYNARNYYDAYTDAVSGQKVYSWFHA